MVRYRLPLFGLALLACGPLLASQTLYAKTKSTTIIYVSTTDDDLVVNGNCTLREAVIAANTNTAVDRCPAGGAADTIVVPGGSYVLSLMGPGDDAAQSGDLDVAGDITLRGAGASATIIDGGWFGYGYDDPDVYMLADRVIHVLAGGRLMLSGVAIQGGACMGGGGVLNAGTLVVGNSIVQLNDSRDTACGEAEQTFIAGAGIYNLGDLVVSDSMVSGNWVYRTHFSDVDHNGGGLVNLGSARIDRSLLTENAAAAGAAIWNLGELHVFDTQIHDNYSRFHGAGLENTGSATLTRTSVTYNVDGGIRTGGDSGTLILRNSTVSHNTGYHAAPGVVGDGGTVAIVNSTIANNSWGDLAGWGGAGIAGAAPVHLRNTVIANNGTGNCAAFVISLGNNLDSDGSCGLNSGGDLSNTDALLAPLADNGGPTLTHALLTGSPAMNHIPRDECETVTDQRGVPRPQPRHGRCDIGAYEFSLAGDIGLITNEVKVLYQNGQLTRLQERALLEPLRTASLLASTEDAGGTCQALDDFAVLVAGYVSDGTLAADIAQPLLDDAHRVEQMICR